MDEDLKKKRSMMEGKEEDEKRSGVVLSSNNNKRAKLQDDDDPQQTNVSLQNNDTVPQVPRKRSEVGERIAETGFYQSMQLKTDAPICNKTSKYQTIEVHQAKHYGKVLMLDGVIQLTERDADAYNEMLTHCAMMAHDNPQNVLVIGGGDGYVLSEVLKHSSVKHVDHVDLDGDVVEICRTHFPWSGAWEDPRVKLHIADGAAFVANQKHGFYDVVIQDSSDPYKCNEDGTLVELPSCVLFTQEHFRNVHKTLRDKGVFIFQSECFQIPSDLDGIVKWRNQALDLGFHHARYGSITISSYPTGQVGFLLCEKDRADVGNHHQQHGDLQQQQQQSSRINQRFQDIVKKGCSTTYYHPRLQKSCFDLPLWVEKRIYGDETRKI